MIDIETLGTSADSCIIAIGACVFDGRWFETREVTVTPDYDRASLDTLAWWKGQEGGPQYLEELETAADFRSLEPAWRELMDEMKWFDREVVKKTRFWCRGMEFDFKLLEHQLPKVPWKYYQLRDLRTLHKAWGNPAGYQAPEAGVAHRAGEDAYQQNQLLQAIQGDISRLQRGHLL